MSCMRIMNMSNYKSTAFTCLDFWSMRSALQLSHPTKTFDLFEADYSSDVLTLNALNDECLTSSIAKWCWRDMPNMDGIRYISSFVSGRVNVRV